MVQGFSGEPVASIQSWEDIFVYGLDLTSPLIYHGDTESFSFLATQLHAL